MTDRFGMTASANITPETRAGYRINGIIPAMSSDKAARMWGIFLGQHYADVAHRAMRLQYQRLIKASPPALADGFMFALALADLAKAARVAAGRAPSPAIESALSDFERAVPGAKDCRDLLEHWDAYAEGRGKAQKRLALPKGRIWFWWKSTSPPILRIGGSADGLDLDITEAKNAGARLYEAVERFVLSAHYRTKE